MSSMPASPNLVGYVGAWVDVSLSGLSARLLEASGSDASGASSSSQSSSSQSSSEATADASAASLPGSLRRSRRALDRSADSSAGSSGAGAFALAEYSLGGGMGGGLSAGGLSARLARGARAWLFVQMEFCPFPTLAHWLALDASGRDASGCGAPAEPSDATRWRWIEGAARGLEVMHAAGWVHNDLKVRQL